MIIVFFCSSGFSPTVPRSTFNLNILAVNDFHGQIDRVTKFGDDKVGSAPYLAAYLKDRKKRSPNVMLVHSGDMVGASSASSALLQDEPSIRILNNIGFDVGTPGNHEFDKGFDNMMRLIKGGYHPKTGHFEGANFPYISANIVTKATQDLIFPPYLIKNINGISVGFIGVTSKQSPSIIESGHIQDISFLDEVEAINKYTRELKVKGANIVAVLAHEGGFQDTSGKITGPVADIANELDPAVDIIFAGHSHSYLNGYVNDKLIVQSSNYGVAITDVKLKIDSSSGKILSKKAFLIRTKHSEIDPDRDVQKITDDSFEAVRPIVSEELGVASLAITKQLNTHGESALGNLVADSQRSEMDAEISFVNQSGMRADLPKGKITWGDVYRVLPFDNRLTKMNLTGRQVKLALNQQFQTDRIHRLQISGIKYSYDMSKGEHGEVVEATFTNGTPIDDEKIYSVVVNSFIASGGSNFTVFKEGTNRVEGTTIFLSLINYIKKQTNPIEPRVEGRSKKKSS